MDDDEKIISYEVREIVSRFANADAFENAVDLLEASGISADAIHMWGSHDAVEEKLGHLYVGATEVDADEKGPQPIFEDRHGVKGSKSLAVGVPVYIGGAGAGLAVAATGGTLAFGALLVAAGMAAGAGIGSILARIVGKRHAAFLAHQLELGALLVWVEVESAKDEAEVIRLLESAGGKDVHAHSLTRYAVFDRHPLQAFDAEGYWGRGDFY